MPSVTVKSLKEAEKWAKDLALTFKRPCVVLLDGDLGAGKTQFVRWFVEALGGSEASSPTFAIHQTYRLKDASIDHLDLYRLEGVQDLESTGFWDLLKQDYPLIFVEWAGRLPSNVWPKHWQVVSLEIFKESQPEARRIEKS